MLVRFLILVVAVGLCEVVRGQDNPAQESDKLEGDWRVTAAEDNGKKMPADEVKLLSFSIAGKEFTVVYANFIIMKGTYAIDATQTPKTIDLKSIAGKHEGKTVEGIYELKKDGLKICFAEPAGKRPKHFTSTADHKAFLLVGERKKAEPAKNWLAQWYYDKETREKADNPAEFHAAIKIFVRSATTTDSAEKVAEFYQGVINKNAEGTFKAGDRKKGNFVDLWVPGGIGSAVLGPGESRNGVLTVDPAMAKLFNMKIDPDFHVYTLGKDDSLDPAADKKDALRPVFVRIYTQDTKEYTVAVVITRAKNEKHTHIVMTFVRR